MMINLNYELTRLGYIFNESCTTHKQMYCFIPINNKKQCKNNKYPPATYIWWFKCNNDCKLTYWQCMFVKNNN